MVPARATWCGPFAQTCSPGVASTHRDNDVHVTMRLLVNENNVLLNQLPNMAADLKVLTGMDDENNGRRSLGGDQTIRWAGLVPG